jgi:hypothetical protein
MAAINFYLKTPFKPATIEELKDARSSLQDAELLQKARENKLYNNEIKDK